MAARNFIKAVVSASDSGMKAVIATYRGRVFELIAFNVSTKSVVLISELSSDRCYCAMVFADSTSG